MNILNILLGIPFGYVIYLAYQLTDNYGVAIIIFAVVTLIVLFPVQLFAHKNSIRLLQIQPELTAIKRLYSGDRERLNEERYNLFQKEKYNPLVGLIPIFVRLFIIIGVMQVMYHPLQHIAHLSHDIIEIMINVANELTGIIGGTGEELRVIMLLKHPENIPAFQAALADYPNAGNIIRAAADTNLNFLGLNLGVTPSITNPNPELIVPFLATITTLAFCLTQTAISPGALSQGKKANWGFTLTTVAFTMYIVSVTPVGVGVFWMAKNTLSILVLIIKNVLINPKKHAGESLVQIKANRKTFEQQKEEWVRNRQLRSREKQDVSAFQAADKKLVFYALSSGQYKFYKNYIDYILENSDMVIHYLTNDPDDALFQGKNDRLIPYYLRHQKTIPLMLKLDTDILVTTVPGLQKYHIKKSIARDDIEYIFTPHSMGLTGGHFTSREGATDHYSTFFAVGQHHIDIARWRENRANIKPRKLVKTGFPLYDQLLESYSKISHINNEKPRILIAPSWQKDNILDLCIDDMLKTALGNGYELIIRPHPQYINMFPEHIELLKDKYMEYINTGEIKLELDFSENESIFSSDILVTDWSNIAFEFSLCTFKPTIFINTPRKVLNPNYDSYGPDAPYVSLREEIGVCIDLDDIKEFGNVVKKVLADKDSFKKQLKEIADKYIFHHGRSGEAGGRYIINQLQNKERTT